MAQEIAHNQDQAVETYRGMESDDLYGVAKQLVHDGKGAIHYAVTFFALERLQLVALVLMERETKARAKIRRLERELENRPPAVKIKPEPGVTT